MRAIACLLLTLAGSHDALAHGLEAPGHETAWTFDPWVIVPLGVLAILYGLGVAAVWRRAGAGHGIARWQAAAFGAGWLTLAGALVSPLHALGEHLFAIHMIEHEIVMTVSAPLMVVARPIGGLVWAFPAAARASIGKVLHERMVKAVWRVMTRPRNATLLHGLAIWVWHAPSLFDAAVVDVVLHRLQHLSFFVTALLFWWALIRRSDAGAAVWHLFVTMIHTAILGALIALAPRVLYQAQTSYASRLGLTPLEDQQLAGIIMWVPAGTVYAAAALAFVARWVQRAGADRRPNDAIRQS